MIRTRLQRIACIALAWGLAVIGLLPLTAPNVHAADGALNLTTSPLPISLVAKPGTTTTTDIRIKNSGDQAEKLKVGLLKFGAYGEDGKPQLLDFTANDEYKNWVTFSQDTFTAQPNAWNTIKMTIKLPKSAAFGYYYAVTFSRQKEDGTSDKRQALSGATAVLVLLEAQVPGAKRDVEVLEYKSKHKIYEFLPATFTARLRNSGNVHVAPRGNIFITKGKKDIGTLEVNQERGNILPSSNRILDAQWSDGFPQHVQKQEDGKVVTNSKSEAETELSWNLSKLGKLRFGKYTASMVLAYDDGTGRDVPIEAAVSFWVIPWRIILGILFIVVLLGFGIWGGVRSVMGSRKSSRRSRRR